MSDHWASSLAGGLELEDTLSRPFNQAIDFSVMGDRLGQVKKSNR